MLRLALKTDLAVVLQSKYCEGEFEKYPGISLHSNAHVHDDGEELMGLSMSNESREI